MTKVYHRHRRRRSRHSVHATLCDPYLSHQAGFPTSHDPQQLACATCACSALSLNRSFLTFHSVHGPLQHQFSTALHLWEPPSMFVPIDDAASMGPFHGLCVCATYRSPTIHAIPDSATNCPACAGHDAARRAPHVQHDTISYLCGNATISCHHNSSNACNSCSSKSRSRPSACDPITASSPSESSSWPQTKNNHLRAPRWPQTSWRSPNQHWASIRTMWCRAISSDFQRFPNSITTTPHVNCITFRACRCHSQCSCSHKRFPSGSYSFVCLA